MVEVAGASVQIGDPITEKLLIDVLDEAAGLWSAITDCGAGGLSSAVGEMAEGIGADVELDRSREELSNDGFDPEVVERALGMIDRAEYKRRQAPPGVKLRPKAFGRDRRTPITNRWPG